MDSFGTSELQDLIAERPGPCVSLYAPVIVKYRDEKTETAIKLEELLR